jgi:hypothetical protein
MKTIPHPASRIPPESSKFAFFVDIYKPQVGKISAFDPVDFL